MASPLRANVQLGEKPWQRVAWYMMMTGRSHCLLLQFLFGGMVNVQFVESITERGYHDVSHAVNRLVCVCMCMHAKKCQDSTSFFGNNRTIILWHSTLIDCRCYPK